CYQDNSFGLFQLSAEACDFITASQEIFAEESRVQVYPNPNEGLFTGDVTSTALYSVYNNFGRLVINGELIAGKNNVMLPAVLSKGVYVLVITDSKSNVVKNKIAVR
ncbi:MAG TPA: T9SS type A sorting domain-containing protein, partial [Flavobacteriales bacterium]|nr:T9SS type A sorting domain-containing protein [Flavobacteriales bacterium]